MRPLLYIRYLALPARPVPLLLIAVLAGGLALASQAGLLGIPLALILLSWAFKYAFVAFDTVARGFDELPVLSIEMVNPVDEQRPLGIILIVLVSHGITAALQPIIGEVATMALRAAVLLSLPASIAVLGVTGRIIDAVNPKMLGGLMRRLGPDYFVLLVVIAAIAVLVSFLSSLGLWLIARLCVAYFGLLALFCLMGGMVYERRETLGLDAWRSPERTEARESRVAKHAVDREMDELYGHWRSGAHLEAWQALQKKLEAQNHALDAYRRFYPPLARWPDPRIANKLGREFISRLIAARQTSEALRILRERLAADAAFRPANSAELVRLVHLARDSGDRATARALLRDFDQHFPADRASEIVRKLADELSGG